MSTHHTGMYHRDAVSPQVVSRETLPDNRRIWGDPQQPLAAAGLGQVRSKGRRMRAGIVAVAASVGLSLSLSGCGLGTSAGSTPPAEIGPNLGMPGRLDGVKVSVGGKQFTEQLILGKIAVIVLRAAGANVTDLTGIPGSSSARQAMLAGQVDMEYEYTGTAWISYLGKTTPLKTPQEQFAAVRDADVKNGLTWLTPAPMNNTYGFALKSDVAKRLGVKTLSDVRKVPVSERTLCVDSEFAARQDGLQPMLKTYGIPLGSSGVPRNQVKSIDSGAIYSAVDSGSCNFGEVFTTDGRIKSLNLTVLDDDKKFFPLYNAAPVFRSEVVRQHPRLREVFTEVDKKLTNDTLIELNAKVDVQGAEPADVAHDWLKSQGFIR